MATVITTLAQLRSACANGGEYELGADISGVYELEVLSGVSVTLDLKTYDLIGTGSSTVIYVNGQLTIDGTTGRITGGYARGFGGGVYVYDGGKFIMYGGTITGNTAVEFKSEGGSGGGVYARNRGEFIMYGGTITGNTTTNSGGGVTLYEDCTFTMTGGRITGNTSGSVAGVSIYSNSMFNISGNAIIKDNAVGDLYVDAHSIISISGNIALDADIRITYPTPALGGTICANPDNYTGVNRIISTDGTLMGGMSGTNVVWVPYEEPPEPVAITLPVNVNGVWKDAVPKVNVNGVWKKVIGIWANVSGDWKKVA